MSSTSTPRRALAGLALSLLLAALGTSSATIALPTLGQSFAAPFPVLQWVVLAYLATSTALVVGAGRIGDLLGRRRLLLGALSLFTLASILCALAPSLPVLIAGRALQGIGAAAMLALTVALAGSAVPKEQTGRAVGLMGGMSALGTAAGPSVGGFLIAHLGWPSLFWLNVPLALIALGLVTAYGPADAPSKRGGSAAAVLPGTLLLALALAGGALAITLRGPFASAERLGSLAVATIALLLFFARDARAAVPLLPWSLLRTDGRSRTLLVALLVAAIVMTSLAVGPFYLARGLGLSPDLAGLILSCGPAMTALMGVPAGRLTERWGSKSASRIGLIGMAAASLLMALVVPGMGVLTYGGALMLLTASYSLANTANTAGLMQTAPTDQRGLLSGLLTLARNLGLIAGASAMAALFALGSGAADSADAAPAQTAQGLTLAFLVAAGLAGVGLVSVRVSAR